MHFLLKSQKTMKEYALFIKEPKNRATKEYAISMEKGQKQWLP